jgi:CDP-4-dehydro-6-deoxyglucose reductase
MKKIATQAKVVEVTPLTDSILQLVLVPDDYVEYQAGQYLQILLNDEALSYSIANAPLGSHRYELHIRHSETNPFNQLLFAQIKQSGVVQLKLPLGNCSINHLHPEKPILFIAGGTGFAPIKAMIEQLLSSTDKRPFELFWGARSQSDLYMDEKVNNWQSHVSHFKYFTLCSNQGDDSLASLVLSRHKEDIKKWQIVISGPFDMVYNVRDMLVASGVSQKDLYSDAFSFESKGSK